MPLFHILSPHARLIEKNYYLKPDDWNDWFKFKTQYKLLFVENGILKSIGMVKIGQKGLGVNDEKQANIYASPNLPEEFEKLSDDFISIGQEEDYYSYLGKMPETREVLMALRDCAYSKEIQEAFKNELVYFDSLMRFIDSNKLELFNNLAYGNAKNTRFCFDFKYDEMTKVKYADESDGIAFTVTPNQMPPENIHAVIGSNGVGKTFLLGKIMEELYNTALKKEKNQLPFILSANHKHLPFSRVVFVSFSNFDKPPEIYRTKFLQFQYIGYSSTEEKLDNSSNSQCKYETAQKNEEACCEQFEANEQMISKQLLASRFAESLTNCYNNSVKWERILTLFDIFKYDSRLHLVIGKILTVEDENELKKLAQEEFKQLSSGHSILLLIISRLVELVEQRTLVLIDEPEAHLHPPLLSAFMRSLSWLLSNRNAMAIVVTHSPVVLQEVPRKCVWIIERPEENSVKVKKPKIETFGENIGILMNEIFKLEISKTGYVALISKFVEKYNKNYQEILEQFGNALGDEAKAILFSMCN